MNFIIDNFGKVTVSLGGVCPLRCAHCYVTVKQFRPSPKRKVGQVIEELKQLHQPFSTVCISGDTDIFLDRRAGLDLIHQVALSFPSVDIMFTSRLVPGDTAVDSIILLGQEMASAGRLLIPCVSVVSSSYPNVVENPRSVPPTDLRLSLSNRYTKGNLPCFLTMRPTFPFNVVSRAEVRGLIEKAIGSAAAVLGESFILDPADEIASRLGMSHVTPEESLSPLSFLSQPGVWRKINLGEEIDFTRAVCEEYGLPYFMRSMSAVSFLKKYWDYAASASTYKKGDHLDMTMDSILP